MARLSLPTVTVDLTAGAVHHADGREAQLTSRELALMGFFAAQPGVTHPREHLLTEVWGYAAGVSSRTLDTTIKTLRQKLEPDPKHPSFIRTVWGTGYRFCPPEPLPRSPGFVGRHLELSALVEALTTERLVLVTGPGGIGKTRLIEEATRAMPDAYIVDLSGVHTEADLEASVLLAIETERRPRGDLEARLRAVRPLLVLDGLEGLSPTALTRLGAWHGAVPELRILGASRIPMELPNALTLPLGPLSVAEGVELLGIFRGDWHGPDVASAIVQAVDGFPLGIELAVCKARMLSPSEVLERLQAPEFLGRRGHEAIRSLMKQTWALLSSEQRAVLTTCAVFAAPFSVSDVEAVHGDALETLEGLADWGLVTRGPQGLQLLRQVKGFAVEHLEPAVFIRHAERVLSVEADPDDTNRVAELRALIGQVPAVLAVRAALALAATYRHLGAQGLRLEASEIAVREAATTADAHWIASALQARLHVRMTLGRAEPADLDELAETAASTGDPVWRARACMSRGWFHLFGGALERSRRSFTEALEWLQDQDAPALQARVHTELGTLVHRAGQTEVALRHFECAIDRLRGSGDDAALALAFHRLGSLHIDEGCRHHGRNALEQALKHHELTGYQGGVMMARAGLARLELDDGDKVHARETLSRCLAWADQERVHDVRLMLHSQMALACLELGDLPEAVRHQEIAGTVARAHPGTLHEGEFWVSELLVAAATQPRQPALRVAERAVARCEALEGGYSAYALGFLSVLRGESPQAERDGPTTYTARAFQAVLRGEPGELSEDAPNWLYCRALMALMAHSFVSDR